MSENQEEAQVVTPGAVGAAARMVAHYLKTRSETKKHGGYDIYEDDVLEITLDTYVPNLDVRLLIDGEWVTVLSAGYHSYTRPQVFRPGAWCDHLLGPLQKQAEQRRELLRLQATTRQEAELVKRYAPVQDAHLFADADPEG